MIAVANESARTANSDYLPENGLNQNWLPFVDNYRTFLIRADVPTLDGVLGLCA